MPPLSLRIPIAVLVACAPLIAGAPMAASAQTAAAPYETRLLRLSEILGSLHYLRNLCGESGQQWRQQMESLLEAENPPAERRARYVARFNHGYRAFSGSHLTCTASATEAIARYTKEGEDLSREIVTIFGN